VRLHNLDIQFAHYRMMQPWRSRPPEKERYKANMEEQ
jgi:hypothetical protein